MSRMHYSEPGRFSKVVRFTDAASRAFSYVSVILMAGTIWASQHLETRARLQDETPPQDWVLNATPDEFLELPGHRITYWGKPDARYS
ncbi:MAG: hypothetical protein ACR2O4_01450, partial [Hyphomicrobiaceae bacterium]